MKYALVTGADHGVGLALVEELLKRDYYVVATGYNPKEGLLAKVLEKNPSKMVVLQLDIGSDDSVAAMKKQARRASSQVSTPRALCRAKKASSSGEIRAIPAC